MEPKLDRFDNPELDLEQKKEPVTTYEEDQYLADFREERRSRKACEHSKNCRAKLCYLEEPVDTLLLWSPKDEVCIAARPPHWVSTQRKLSALCRIRNRAWTIDMLKLLKNPGRGSIGIDPTKSVRAEVQRWKKENE